MPGPQVSSYPPEGRKPTPVEAKAVLVTGVYGVGKSARSAATRRYTSSKAAVTTT
jgi:hypothetical protein